MANLDKSNVVNGNTISASDITALYDTFTGVNTANNIDIQGTDNNFRGTASKADTLRYTNGSSNHEYSLVFVTGSSQYKTAFVDSNNAITYNPSTDLLTVTASLAVTSSFALDSGAPTQVLISVSPDSVTPAGAAAPWTPFGGVLDTSQAAFVDLQQVFGFTPISGFGIDIIVTANEIAPSGGSPGIAVSPFIDFAGQANELFFAGNSGAGVNALVVYQGWYRV